MSDDTKPGQQKTKAPEPFASDLLDWLHNGGSVLAWTKGDGRPSRATIYRWTEGDEEFARQFARAREAGAAHLIDLAQDVADDGRNDTYTDDEGRTRTDFDVVARSKLRVDTLLKRAACYCPRLYGTKVSVGGDAAAPPIKVEQVGPAVPPTADLLAGVRKLAELAEELVGDEDDQRPEAPANVIERRG